MAKIGIFREGIYPSGGIETWLEPKHVAVVDGYDGKTKGLKIVK